MAEKVTTQPTYRVVFERDDNNRWFVRCPDIAGAHSHGRTLASARTNIREAIALILDITDDTSISLAEEIRLPHPDLQQAVRRARCLRERAHEIEEEARNATFDAITVSLDTDSSLGVRDLADLLGISHQRVQQLAAEDRGVNQGRP
jgi:predicted RNase H-like HicB family nuclease